MTQVMIDGVVRDMTPEEEEAFGAQQYQDSLPKKQDYEREMTVYLNKVAAERLYDNIAVGATYRDDPNSQYAAEGQAMYDWRSQVWTAAEEFFAGYDAGTVSPLPTLAEFIDSLPKITWPAAKQGKPGK